jgi:LEA14-like dessication related protein
MNKKLLIGTGFAAGFILLICGLYKWYMVQLDKVMQYCYKIKRYKFNTISLDKIDMTIDVLIRNKSAFDFDVYGYDMAVYINDIKIAKLKDQTNQHIVNNGLSLIKLNVNVLPKEVFKDAKKLGEIISWSLLDKEKVKITVDGTISAGSSFLKVRDLPIKITMTLKEIMTDDPNAEVCTVV